MISAFYGRSVELHQLRNTVSISLKGATLAQLMKAAQAMGMASRAVRVELDELGKLSLPCIVHLEFNHFAVLERVSSRRVVLLDPAAGRRVLPMDEFGRIFTGVALELSTGPDFKRQAPGQPVSIRALGGSIHGLGKALSHVFILALVLEVFSLLTPQYVQITVDQVLADGDHDLLKVLGLSFVLLLVLQTAVTGLRTWLLVWIGTRFNLTWTGRVFQHLLRLPQAYFLKRHLGDIVSRFGAITSIQQTLTSQFIGVILDGVMATATLVMLIAYSLPLASIVAASVALYALFRVLYFATLREANLSQIVVTAKQQSAFMEAVRGVQTIKLFNQGADRTNRYLNSVTDVLNTSVAMQRLSLAFGSINSLVSGLQRIALLWLGAWLALKGTLTAGALMAFVAYADQFTSRASNLVDYLIQFRLLRLQTERLADIVMTPPELFAESNYGGPAPAASISFRNVGFRYADGEPWILKDCSFDIEQGQSVAFVGPSGCGKSTLLRLLLGLLDPQEGKILIGDVDLRHLGKDAYREIAAGVMQDDRLFAGTVSDNISMFDERSDMENVMQAARNAQIHDDICTMPMGYQSLVGDMGSSLSGGQQQRLWLARLFYRRPAIAVLDEATSHLDNTCEKKVNDAFDGTGMTRVVVAHRLETIKSAERVLVLINGNTREATSQGQEGERTQAWA